MASVNILMSTYNGEKYLREQLDSIYAQDGVQLGVYVRDDGSTDSTCEILKEYEEKHGLSWYHGENIGVNHSFMELLYNAPDADYYAFADQDDVWHMDKLSRSISTLSKYDMNKPLLYACNQNFVDENLNFQSVRLSEKHVQNLSLAHLVLSHNFCGCTMTMNRKLRDTIILDGHHPNQHVFRSRGHDTWTLYIAIIFGEMIFDHKPLVDYRRHTNTVTRSIPKSQRVFFSLAYQKIRSYFNKEINNRDKGSRAFLANEILRLFRKDIPEQEIGDLELIASYSKSIGGKIRFMKNGNLVKNESDPWIIAVYKIWSGYY